MVPLCPMPQDYKELPMEKIQLHCNTMHSVTMVSNNFIDEYLPNANGEFVKVYLYLLRCMHSVEYSCTLSAIADRLNHTETDVKRALLYWEKLGFVKLGYKGQNVLASISLTTPTQPDIERNHPQSKNNEYPLENDEHQLENEDHQLENDDHQLENRMHPNEITKKSLKADPKVIPKTIPSYSAKDLEKFIEKEDIQEIFFAAENYIQRPLSETETNTLLFWYDTLHFSSDLIEYLIGYCIDRGAKGIKYMDTIARAWAEIDIHTLEAAKEYSKLNSEANTTVKKAFGISGRNLVPLETDMIRAWLQEYGFSLDLIKEACNRTIKNTQQPRFDYANTILLNWKKDGVKSIKDIQASDHSYHKSQAATPRNTKQAANNRFTNIAQRTYDYNELEKQFYKRNKE